MEKKTAQRYFFAKCYYFGERELDMPEKTRKIRAFTGKTSKIPQNIKEKHTAKKWYFFKKVQIVEINVL